MNLKLEMSRYWPELEVIPNRADINEDMIHKEKIHKMTENTMMTPQ